MTLLPVETPEDFSLAEQFLLPHEETCVSLASLVRRKSDKLVFINSEPEVLGLLYLDSTIYHCIPKPDLLEADFLKDQLPYLLKKQVKCISGEKKATDFLLKLFPDPAQVYNYKMME